LFTEQRLQDYDETAVGQVRAGLNTVDNSQLGDVEKGSKMIVDVLLEADGKEIPIRLPLGSDCYTVIKEKCESTTALLEVWKDVICTTDHPQGQ
jgi:hypothetical protein